jgi:hypothetical protein
MFARVAGDVGLLKPAGPAHHVDLYGIALGEGAGFQLPDQMQGGPALHPMHLCALLYSVQLTWALLLLLLCAAADCLPWCTREDGQHVSDTVNELALQLLANWYMQL